MHTTVFVKSIMFTSIVLSYKAVILAVILTVILAVILAAIQGSKTILISPYFDSHNLYNFSKPRSANILFNAIFVNTTSASELQENWKNMFPPNT